MFTGKDREILVHNNNYALSRITESDREEFVELQRQINGNATMYLNPISKDIMWDSILSEEDMFAIFDEKMTFCGTIELQDRSRTPEIGISILEKYRNKGIARNAIDLLIELTYDLSKMDYYLLRIEKENAHSRHVFEKIGAEYLNEDLSTLDRFKEFFKKNNWEEKYQDELADIYESFEGDSDVLLYKLDPAGRK